MAQCAKVERFDRRNRKRALCRCNSKPPNAPEKYHSNQIKSSIPSSSCSLGLPQWKKKLQNRKLNINEEREPSSCDLDTLGYGGSWMVLPYLFPPSPSLSLSLAPLPLHSLRLRIFNFKLHRVIIRATLILLDTMGRVISYNPIIFKKILN